VTAPPAGSIRLAAAAALTALVAACGPAQEPAGEAGSIVTWQCGDLRVVTEIRGDSLRLSGPFGERVLAQERSASGARYADGGGTELWEKAGRAMLTLDGERQPDCNRTDAISPWEAARARGVAFRAVGNEPGWWVEVDGGGAPPLRAEFDFGARRVEVASAAATADGWRGAAPDGTQVVLEVRREPCTDTMSGHSLPAAATLRVGGASWRGCGRFLLE
jgi:uncharacterized membrane protein/membrane-bound inhibitor of C-type lysozyme